MTPRIKIVIVGVALIVAFASGRYLTPEKVKIETKIVEVEAKTKETEAHKHKETTTTVIKEVSGKEETTTVVVEDSGKDIKSTDNINKTTDTLKEVTTGSSKVTISALGAFDFKAGKPAYGISVTKPILGPIAIGLFGLTNDTLGCSLGISF